MAHSPSGTFAHVAIDSLCRIAPRHELLVFKFHDLGVMDVPRGCYNQESCFVTLEALEALEALWRLWSGGHCSSINWSGRALRTDAEVVKG